MSASEVDYAWAAGMLDGDGVICLHRIIDKRRERHGHRATLQLTQKGSHAPAEKLRRILGGTVAVRGDGCVYWKLLGASEIAPHLERLIPHLTRKRPEAELVLAYCRGPGRHNGRIRVRDEVWEERERLTAQMEALREARRR